MAKSWLDGAAVPRTMASEHPLIAVPFTTAMRISTALALALERDDFEPQLGCIVVRRRRSGGEVPEAVKRSRTAVGHRPLVPEVIGTLSREEARSLASRRRRE